MAQLTLKQERFAQLYIETGNASEAYRQAYDAARMKAETIHVKASQLLGKDKVAVRIAALQAEHRVRHNVTVDSLTIELENARQLAHQIGQAGAAVSATLGKAKLHGLLRDKVELGADASLVEVMRAIDGRTRNFTDQSG